MDQHKINGRHYGNISEVKSVGPFSFMEINYASGNILPWHYHDRACLCLVLHGLYDEIYSNRIISCNDKTLLLRPAGAKHKDKFYNVPVRCFLVEFTPTWLKRITAHTNILASPLELKSCLPVHLAKRLYIESREVDNVTPLITEGLILELLAVGSRQVSRRVRGVKPRWLSNAEEMLRTMFQEPPSLAEIATAVGVHPTHLSREFRRYLYCTVGEYIRRLRIEYTCQQITSTDLPLAQIALDAGFTHQAHFSRTFKSIMGITPAKFRASYRLR